MTDYNKNILPSECFKPFIIEIWITLTAVGEIDETEEKLSTVMLLTYSWHDKNIKWDPQQTNVIYMAFGWTDVWKPVFQVTNPHAEISVRQSDERLYDTVIFMSSGWAFFDEMIVTRTTCDLDMTFYPFDIHTCIIQFRIVGHSKFPFCLNATLVDDNTASSVAEHRTWSLIHKDIYSSGGSFQIELKFERHPLFILLNILMPIIVIALLTPIVFILPMNSGGRVGYAMTMLLALSVYMTIVSDHLPQKSEPLPIILVLMFMWYTMDASIVSIVIINARIHELKKEKPLPYMLRRFVHLTCLISLQKRKREAEAGSSEETHKCIDRGATNNKGEANQDEEIQELNDVDTNNEDYSSETWQDLSKCIDKWCFVLFYMLKVTCPVAFFSFVKSSSTI
ncbi:acetylcholine receptor subunit beta-like [Mercenaria mercenaria]|uniref:acetylcholine receptor subunit beta-like n=1 Tax=Mercenaria mercenaria TaxID=6596 RepID=UPI00234F1418|nr:acetylcholine receptor subunit beta-like [Mercenaria mercenaria]